MGIGQAFLLIITLAIITEGLIEFLGFPLPSKVKPYAAALVGLVICVAYDADLLAALGFPSRFPYVGAVLTGLLSGRGSSYINDLVSRLRVIQAPAVPVTHVEDSAEDADIQEFLQKVRRDGWDRGSKGEWKDPWEGIAQEHPGGVRTEPRPVRTARSYPSS